MRSWYRVLGLLAILALVNLGVMNAAPYSQYGTCYLYCDGQMYVANATYQECCVYPRYWAEGCYSVGNSWTPDGEGWPEVCGG